MSTICDLYLAIWKMRKIFISPKIQRFKIQNIENKEWRTFIKSDSGYNFMKIKYIKQCNFSWILYNRLDSPMRKISRNTVGTNSMELRARLSTFRFHKFYFPTLVNKVKQAWAHFGKGGSWIEFHISNLWQLPHDIVFYRVDGGWRLLAIDLRSGGTCAFNHTCDIACFDTYCVHFTVRWVD